MTEHCCYVHMIASATAAAAFAGGEALTPKLAEDICATLPGLSRGGLFNSYGPTEVTVTVSIRKLYVLLNS
jgi:non-ribosomal peptide synthetase component F